MKINWDVLHKQRFVKQDIFKNTEMAASNGMSDLEIIGTP